MVLKLKAGMGFFDLKPYTKVASWGKQYRNLKNYALKNELQALGLAFETGAKKPTSDQLLKLNLRQSPQNETF